MHRDFHLDVDRIRAQGLSIGIGKRLTRGRLLRLKGHAEIVNGLDSVIFRRSPNTRKLKSSDSMARRPFSS
jgi:hypothetical protein